MKLLGAALVVAGCAFVGFYAAICQKIILSDLKKLMHMLEFMSCELRYKLTPLPALLRETAKQGSGFLRSYFSDLANELDSQIKPDVASCMAVVLEKHTLIPLDVQICLMELSGSLGRFDLDGQLEGLAYVRCLCTEKINTLEEGREARLRTYQTLGLCAGAAIAVIML